MGECVVDSTAFGQPLVDDHLPDDFLPMDVVAIVKGMRSDGSIEAYECASEGLSTWEALGLVISCSNSLEDALRGE